MDSLEKENKQKKTGYLFPLGILLLISSIVILGIIYSPVIFTYIDYILFPAPKNTQIEVLDNDKNKITQNISQDTKIVFVDNEFGIYIPKIKTNSKVIPNVDPYDFDEYRNALSKGIAHALGTSLPNEHGNVFLFAHSTVNFYERKNYSVYFYLLGELEQGDEIYISYDSVIYPYTVYESKVVEPTDTQYLGTYMDEDTLTLMTCWPIGMNKQRYIVTAIRAQE